MEEVTKESFYKIIGPLDVISSVVGDYPYTSIFRMRYGKEVGRHIDSYPENGVHPIVSRFFIV